MIDGMNIDIYEKKGRYGYEKEMDHSVYFIYLYLYSNLFSSKKWSQNIEPYSPFCSANSIFHE